MLDAVVTKRFEERACTRSGRVLRALDDAGNER